MVADSASKEDVIERNPPPGWGDDELSKFLDNARGNQWATFNEKKEAVGKLVRIDAQFVKVSKDWLNPDSEICAYLLLRCHSAFRTASGLAMSGQAAEAYVQSRAMLENAAYAVHIYRAPAFAEIWLNRHEDAASMRAQKEAFKHGNVLASVIAANKHAGERFAKLYQDTIDFGAHPNERSITSNMQVIETDDRRNMVSIMQHGDSKQLDYALKTVAQCGLNSLEMLQSVFNARFELLGINAEMIRLRKGL
jgi:hypothetical protein